MTNNGHKRPGESPSVEERVEWGRVFSVRTNANAVADGSSLNLVLSNPPDSGVNLLTVAPGFSSHAAAFIEKIENPTIDASGTAVDIRNKNLGSSRESAASAETGGTYSGGTSRGIEAVGSSAGGGSGGALGAVDLSLRIPEGGSARYRMESDASNNDLSIAVNFIEDPV